MPEVRDTYQSFDSGYYDAFDAADSGGGSGRLGDTSFACFPDRTPPRAIYQGADAFYAPYRGQNAELVGAAYPSNHGRVIDHGTNPHHESFGAVNDVLPLETMRDCVSPSLSKKIDNSFFSSLPELAEIPAAPQEENLNDQGLADEEFPELFECFSDDNFDITALNDFLFSDYPASTENDAASLIFEPENVSNLEGMAGVEELYQDREEYYAIQKLGLALPPTQELSVNDHVIADKESSSVTANKPINVAKQKRKSDRRRILTPKCKSGRRRILTSAQEAFIWEQIKNSVDIPRAATLTKVLQEKYKEDFKGNRKTTWDAIKRDIVQLCAIGGYEAKIKRHEENKDNNRGHSLTDEQKVFIIKICQEAPRIPIVPDIMKTLSKEFPGSFKSGRTTVQDFIVANQSAFEGKKRASDTPRCSTGFALTDGQKAFIIKKGQETSATYTVKKIVEILGNKFPDDFKTSHSTVYEFIKNNTPTLIKEKRGRVKSKASQDYPVTSEQVDFIRKKCEEAPAPLLMADVIKMLQEEFPGFNVSDKVLAKFLQNTMPGKMTRRPHNSLTEAQKTFILKTYEKESPSINAMCKLLRNKFHDDFKSVRMTVRNFILKKSKTLSIAAETRSAFD
jgi:hypothetical protein